MVISHEVESFHTAMNDSCKVIINNSFSFCSSVPFSELILINYSLNLLVCGKFIQGIIINMDVLIRLF